MASESSNETCVSKIVPYGAGGKDGAESILDGEQLPGTYEDPDGGTLTLATTKMLTSACKRFTPDKRLVMDGTAITTVRLIGKIFEWTDDGQMVKFKLFDGFGTIDCIS
ncbi:hypothetical protein ACP70R_000557 [Stipagrostis hirtigluma subsp. patula]